MIYSRLVRLTFPDKGVFYGMATTDLGQEIPREKNDYLVANFSVITGSLEVFYRAVVDLPEQQNFYNKLFKH